MMMMIMMMMMHVYIKEVMGSHQFGCMSVSNRVVFAQVPVVMSQCINVVTSSTL